MLLSVSLSWRLQLSPDYFRVNTTNEIKNVSVNSNNLV